MAAAAAFAALYYAVAGLVALGSWLWGLAFGGPAADTKARQTEAEATDPRLLRQTEAMACRVDSLMHLPQRLDTAQIAVSIYDLTTGRSVYSHHDNQLLPPASCMKIATAVAAMRTLGMGHQYSTSLLIRGTMRGDTLVGNLLLQADDDPLLEDFSPLAAALRRTGVRHVRGNVYYDLAREDTLRPHPSAKIWDIPYNRTPLLLKGRRVVERQWKWTLASQGVAVKTDPDVRPQGRYRYVSTIRHRLADVVAPMLIHSSNIKADALLYHLDRHCGLIAGRRQDWAVSHAHDRYWRRVFADDSTHRMRGCVINDGSGLSPDNRLTAALLADMLRHAWADEPLRRFLIDTALATPGDPNRRGSLLTRLSRPEYRGRLYCKTGTLTTIGGSSLAGYLRGLDGHWYVFAIINADSPVAESRIFQDRLCSLMMTGRGKGR